MGTHTRDDWLASRVELSRRSASRELCPRCGAGVLVGPDADRCSMEARVDAEPVSRVAEVVALLAGRASYDVAFHRSRIEITHRDDWAIHSPRAIHDRIHIEHHCE